MGSLERKTPLDGGKVEFNFIFYCVWEVGKGDGKLVCCWCVNTQQNIECNFITYMHIKVNILILFIVSRGNHLQSSGELKIWGSGNCTEVSSFTVFS